MNKFLSFCSLAALVLVTGCADMLAPRTRLKTPGLDWANPKNMSADEISIETNTNGTSKARIKNINTVMDAQVIQMSADGLSKILKTAIESAGALAGKAVAP